MAEPRVARARRRWRTGRGHARGSRPCVSRRVHADARVGCHVAGGSAFGGPTSQEFGAVTQMRYLAPHLIGVISFILFRVGLCPTRFLPFARDVAVP